jgi:hypothetical protein
MAVRVVIAVRNVPDSGNRRLQNKANWPLLEQQCWVGIPTDSIGLDPELKNNLLSAARKQFPNMITEPGWVAWRRLTALLPMDRITELHGQITTDPQGSQNRLIEELSKWAEIVRQVRSGP